MRTEKEIRAKIAELKKDDRYKQKPARVDVNAPLALIQVDIGAHIRALEWVLDKGASAKHS